MPNEFSFIQHTSRVEILGHYGALQRQPFAVRVLTEKLLTMKPAADLWQNIKRYDLKPFDPDDLESRQPRALSCDVTPFFEDKFNRLHNWESIVSPEERAQRDAVLKDLKALAAPILAKAEADRSDEEKEDLASFQNEIANLEGKGIGYLENPPDAFSDGVAGLYDSNSAPNVPRHRKSKFQIRPDTPFCLRLFFFKPSALQADWSAIVEIYRYRLKFTESRVDFLALNRKLTAAQIEAKEKQLNDLLDAGRITRADENFKAEKKREIDKIKFDAASAGRKGEKLSDLEKSKIKALEKAIDDRWDSKRKRTSAQEKEIKDLQKELYVATESVNFGQNFETFFNTPLILTFLPQRSGFITIRLEGADSWSYEVREITSKKATGQIWPASKVEVKIAGGSSKWSIGYPKPREGLLVIGPLDPGGDILGVQGNITGQWDTPAQGDMLAPDIAWELHPAPTEMVVNRPALGAHLYALYGTLTPGPLQEDIGKEKFLTGQRLPFLYDADMFIPGTPRSGSDAAVWDSNNYLLEDESSRVVDFKPTWDTRGAMTIGVVLRADEDDAYDLGLLALSIEGRLCNLYIDNIDPGDAPYLARGVITNPEFSAEAREIRFTVADRYALLNEQMRARPSGDNLDLAIHTKNVLQCRGEKENELVGLPESVGLKLEGATVGSDPANQPSKGAAYGRYLEELFERQGMASGKILNLRWHSNAQGGTWVIEPEDENVCTVDGGDELLVEADFRTDLPEQHRLRVRDIDDLPDDDSELWNIFPLEGGKNPENKQPFTSTYTVWESILKPGDMRHIGREKPHPVVTAASLTSQDAVDKACIRFAKTKCRGIKFRKIKTAFFTALRPKRKIKIDGKKYFLVRIVSSSMNEDEKELLCLRLE